MFKLTEKYEDWMGNEREETFYFNLTKSELTKMQFSKNGGFDEYLKKIIATQNQAKLMEIFDSIIDMSYGEISADGRHFVKNEEVLENFKSTAAYSQIFMRLCSDSKFSSEFVNNVFPKDLIKEAQKLDGAPALLAAKNNNSVEKTEP